MTRPLKILALCGGVGGSKLAAGLAHWLGPDLTVVVNTGDDFTHLGLRICPDLDSVCYALAGLNDEARGWGRRDETWRFLESLAALGGPAWFQLGDSDLAMHVLRSAWLAEGLSLSEVTARLATALEIEARIVPMTDDDVATRVDTNAGELAFQEYFVGRACAPVLRGIRFEGGTDAQPTAALLEAHYDGIVICPSNPLVSIDPLLALPGVRSALERRTVPSLAVSPFIAGRAVKGPAAKMFGELGWTPGVAALAARYSGLIDMLLVDAGDEEPRAEPIEIHGVDILMRDAADRKRLARHCLDLISAWRTQHAF